MLHKAMLMTGGEAEYITKPNVTALHLCSNPLVLQEEYALYGTVTVVGYNADIHGSLNLRVTIQFWYDDGWALPSKTITTSEEWHRVVSGDTCNFKYTLATDSKWYASTRSGELQSAVWVDASGNEVSPVMTDIVEATIENKSSGACS